MPELARFLDQFKVRFAQPCRRQGLERYVTGLLSEHPNKNCQTLASVLPQTTDQRLHNLLTDLDWDEVDLNRQRVQLMDHLATEGDGALIFDDTGFAKQGHHSAGVARQYSGTLGKVANCQVTVNCHYAERTIGWPVNTRLYLPQEWIDAPERCRQAHIPEGTVFQTKPQIALDLLDQARQWGVEASVVVSDGDYGDNPHFLDGLEARDQLYVAAIRKDFSVAATAHGPVQQAGTLLAQTPRKLWRSIAWREGSRGWLRARFIAVRCWRVDGQDHRRIGWLIGQRSKAGTREEYRYFWSNGGPKLRLETMAEYAHRRYWVEQFHEESKELLGWDQFQGRRYDAFHRQAVLTMLSFSFLVWLEFHQRQTRKLRGRIQAAFSPSTGSTAAVLGLGAATDRRLDAGRCRSLSGGPTNGRTNSRQVDLTK